jgi:dipeptidyl aminopeptidase/acylaminoacyl peptidase
MSILRRSLWFVVLFAVSAFSQTLYQKPPKAIEDVLNAPATPIGFLSPTQDRMVLAQPLRYPPIAELAQPMLRLAGLRINPDLNGPHLSPRYIRYTIKSLADGKEVQVQLPKYSSEKVPVMSARQTGLVPPASIRSGDRDPHLSAPIWSPDGKQFAFMSRTPGAIELWLADAMTGAIRQVKGVKLNAVFPDSVRWMPGSKSLIIRTVPANRGQAPVAPPIPLGPNVQESYGKGGPAPTYQDTLKDPFDEQLFDYYGSGQLALVDATTLKVTNWNKPDLYTSIEPSPDGNYLLIERIHHPYSYVLPYELFPTEVEVWSRAGKLAYKVISRPLQDNLPIQGVPVGPREVTWKPTEPATLYWREALDGGNPKNKVAERDKLMKLSAPFTAQPHEVVRTQQRLMNVSWSETGALFLTDYDRDRKWIRTLLIATEGAEPKELWSRNQQDRYNDKGTPQMRILPNGDRVIRQHGDDIYLVSQGATREGDRPFLDRFNLKTLASERIFRSDADAYENPVGVLSDDGTRYLTVRETPTTPPNYQIHDGTSVKAFTDFPDPTPQIRGIKKRLVTYKRDDGVDLSFMLYLPPDYKEGTRLPTIIWAYPFEYTDAKTAGQITGSTQRFTTIGGISQLFMVLDGYAVLDNAAMPIIGDPETVNNTFVQQLVADAKAAIDKAVEIGVTDRNRVGVGGHSYGAFMTANLLAHTDFFKAGVARSGAYNRTLTPFGFQSERRTLWEAKDTYLTMSPFLVADKIKTPILLIHGEADNNTGTYPIQSERMYQALRGNGATVRYVTLPFEAHGYAARESTEQTLWEMCNWFDKYVKNAPEK